MEAGIELDKLVAEKLMGWKDVWQPFQPSTDIADAWTVVEKVKSKGFKFYLGDTDSGEYDCVFAKEDFYRCGADTTPLAICLAALKAVGVKIDA